MRGSALLREECGDLVPLISPFLEDALMLEGSLSVRCYRDASLSVTPACDAARAREARHIGALLALHAAKSGGVAAAPPSLRQLPWIMARSGLLTRDMAALAAQCLGGEAGLAGEAGHGDPVVRSLLQKVQQALRFVAALEHSVGSVGGHRKGAGAGSGPPLEVVVVGGGPAG